MHNQLAAFNLNLSIDCFQQWLIQFRLEYMLHFCRVHIC